MREDFYADYFRIEDRHWWFVGRRRIFLSLLDGYLDPDTSGAREILDLGCGTGTMLRYLTRYGRPQGIDADSAAVRFCRERGIDNVQRAAVPPLPFPDQRFDLVTAFDFLEHVDEDRRTLEEIRRVLAPGGLFVITVPAYRFLWGNQDEISRHKRRYTAGRLRADLVEAGLLPRRVTYFNTLLFAPIAAVRLLRRLTRGGERPQSDFDMTDETGLSNRLLARLFSLEAGLLRRFDLPFGVSVLAVAEAPHRDGRLSVES